MLDISLPDRNGIEVLKQIKKERPKIPVLMLSMHDEGLYAIRALKAGASGYITKQSAPGELMAAIHQVAWGRKYLTTSLAEAMADSLGADHERPPHEILIRSGIPDAVPDRLGQEPYRCGRGNVSVRQDGQRLPQSPAGKNEAQE